MSKSKGKTLLTVIAGTGAIAGVGVGAFYIMNSFQHNVRHHYTYYNSEKTELEFGVQLTNNHIKGDVDQFFLSDKGVNELKDKINKCLQYGPEFSELNGIHIDDENIMSEGEGASGAYVPATDQIVINTDTWRKDKFKTVSKDELNDSQEHTKVELIFQVLFHEYGHFLANKYLNSNIKKDLQQPVYSYQSQEEGGKDIFTHVYWNKNFLKDFKKLLNYDDSIPIMSKGKYTPAGYFQKLNQPTQGELKGNDPLIETYDKYYYSMDELLTRKFQLITMPLIGETDGSARLTTDAWYTMADYNGYQHASPWGQDLLKIFDKSTKRQVMNDNPFINQGELFNLLGDYIGFNTTDSISDIYVHDGLVKVGGYTNNSDVRLLIDGKEYIDTTTHKLQNKINSGPSQKDSMTQYNNKKTIRSTKDFWVADNIPIDRIKDKKLELLVNGKITPLTLKDDSLGRITTSRLYLNARSNKIEDRFTKEEYEVIKNDKGIVKIEKGLV